MQKAKSKKQKLPDDLAVGSDEVNFMTLAMINLQNLEPIVRSQMHHRLSHTPKLCALSFGL